MLENGYIKLHRSMLKWDWYDDINTKTVFIHLLLTVGIKDNNWHGIIVERGSRVSSFDVLAKELHMPIRQLRTAIKHLEVTGEVTRSKHPKFTVFTLVNFNNFQEATSKVTSNRQGNDKVVTSNRQQYKKDKKDKKVKEDISPSASPFARTAVTPDREF